MCFGSRILQTRCTAKLNATARVHSSTGHQEQDDSQARPKSVGLIPSPNHKTCHNIKRFTRDYKVGVSTTFPGLIQMNCAPLRAARGMADGICREIAQNLRQIAHPSTDAVQGRLPLALPAKQHAAPQLPCREPSPRLWSNTVLQPGVVLHPPSALPLERVCVPVKNRGH